jgi:hypothetical protein
MQRQLRCLIAAGGTAGHVLPALAIARALNERGVHVTFAGSPDRVEARLVPEAGYELDTFRITGLPRRPSVQLLRALMLAGAAPRACRRILRARQPDVVLGAGGYVAAARPGCVDPRPTRTWPANRPPRRCTSDLPFAYPLATRFAGKTRGRRADPFSARPRRRRAPDRRAGPVLGVPGASARRR